MKALKGLIEAINRGIPLTLYRHSYEAIAQYAAKANLNATESEELVAALKKTSPRFSAEKFFQAVTEFARHER